MRVGAAGGAAASREGGEARVSRVKGRGGRVMDAWLVVGKAAHEARSAAHLAAGVPCDLVTFGKSSFYRVKRYHGGMRFTPLPASIDGLMDTYCPSPNK